MLRALLAQADGKESSPLVWAGIALAVLVVLVFLVLVLPLFWLWLQAFAAKANVRILELIGMRFRKINASVIVLCRIQAVQAGLGLDISTAELEGHYLAGGRPVNLVRAMVVAKASGIELPWEETAALDLRGHDVLAEALELAKTDAPA